MKIPEDPFPDTILKNDRLIAYWDEELECYIYLDPKFEKALNSEFT